MSITPFQAAQYVALKLKKYDPDAEAWDADKVMDMGYFGDRPPPAQVYCQGVDELQLYQKPPFSDGQPVQGFHMEPWNGSVLSVWKAIKHPQPRGADEATVLRALKRAHLTVVPPPRPARAASQLDANTKAAADRYVKVLLRRWRRVPPDQVAQVAQEVAQVFSAPLRADVQEYIERQLQERGEEGGAMATSRPGASVSDIMAEAEDAAVKALRTVPPSGPMDHGFGWITLDPRSEMAQTFGPTIPLRDFGGYSRMLVAGEAISAVLDAYGIKHRLHLSLD